MENETALAATFCDECYELFIAIERGYKFPRSLHKDKASLKISQDSGCWICSRLPFKLASFISSEVELFRYEADPQIPRMMIKARHDDDEVDSLPWMEILIYYRVQDHGTLFGLGYKASIEPNTGNKWSLLLAKEWIQRCVTQHKSCAKSRFPESYPTRLLDIKDDIIRLIDTREVRLSDFYATLSHSWGGAAIKVLTSKTLYEFREGIHLHDIPATFRDAIKVTRAMGILYLWIDCYCIVQSSGERDEEQERELAREVARMDEVYSNSVVNIGASAARSPLDGLFKPRERRIPARIDVGNSSYLVYRADDIYKHDQDFAFPDRSAIFRRAWCMQERILCPRMLHLSHSGMHWECDSEKSSEILPVAQGLLAYDLPYAVPFGVAGARKNVSKAWRQAQWPNIVTMYSMMELSRPQQDKFAACGGVAKLLTALTQDEYVAGFFRQTIVASLAWAGVRAAKNEVNLSPNGLTKRSSPWRAPTWSWVSVDGPVKLKAPSSESRNRAEIVALDVALADSLNPYGALKSAKLTIKGLTAPVKIRYHNFEPSKSCMYRRGVDLEAFLDDMNEPRKDLIMLLTSVFIKDSQSSHHFSGLILTPGQRKKFLKQPVLYRRVGAFDTERASIGGVVTENLEKLFGDMTERVIEIV